jgi:urease accessory protein
MHVFDNHEPWFEFLHLSSMALPVGGFAYSQGLEQAIEAGVITDAVSAQRWIQDCALHNLARQEGVLWHCVFQAALVKDGRALLVRNDEIFALKETAELRLESRQMGQSLAALFSKWPQAQWLTTLEPAPVGWTYTAAHASLCAAVGLSASAGLASFFWAWCENQVLCVVKHLPLGQSRGQALLQEIKPMLQAAIAHILHQAGVSSQANFGSAALGFAINSARHETQYSRLFRS